MALRSEPIYRVDDDNGEFNEVVLRDVGTFIQIDQDGSIIELSRSMAKDVVTALGRFVPQGSGYLDR